MKQPSIFLLVAVFRVSSQFVITCENPENINLRGERKRRSSYLSSATSWPDAKVPYKEEGTLDANLHVQGAISEIEAATCVRFMSTSSQAVSGLGLGHTRIVSINDVNNGGCSSDVGKTGDSGSQFLFLDQSCVNDMSRTTVHEFLHALGFEHEFKRTDRDSYVTVNLDNVVSTGMQSQFVKDPNIETSKRYDISSIMQYTGKAFAKTDTLTMEPVAPILSRVQSRTSGRDNLSGFVRGNNVALSHRDKATISERYNCASACSGITCNNGGYLNSSCTCQCPFGFTGTSCETLDTTNVDAGCGNAELSATSGTITPPQGDDGFKFNSKCIWKVEGATESHRVRVKLTEMKIDSQRGEGSKSDGACGTGAVVKEDSLYVYLYGTDVNVYPVSCSTNDQAIYLNQWSVTDTNVLIIYWEADGVTFDINTFSTLTSATNTGWSLDYEIGTIDGSGNFVPVGSSSVETTTSGTNIETTSAINANVATTSSTGATTTRTTNTETTTTTATNTETTTSRNNVVSTTTRATNAETTTSGNNIVSTTTRATNAETTTSENNIVSTTTRATNAETTTSGNNIVSTTTRATNAETTTNGNNVVSTTSVKNVDPTTSGLTTTAYQTTIKITNVSPDPTLNDINSPAAQSFANDFKAGIGPIMMAINPTYTHTDVTRLTFISAQQRRLLAETNQPGAVTVTSTSYFSSDITTTTGDVHSKMTTELEKRNNQIGRYAADPNSLEVMSGKCDGANCGKAPTIACTGSMLLLQLVIQILLRTLVGYC